MSCHDIGLGMNEVSKEILEQYDKGRVTKSAARRLLYITGCAVNWCDGNEGEAHAYFENCRCGNCLKFIEKGEKLYSLWYISREAGDSWDIEKKYKLASGRLCTKCFDRILNNYCKDPSAGERERKHIEEKASPREYLSEGEYPSGNDIYEWPER
ncbi:MAG: hypothetical protein VZT48_05820 [Bulleidia sp.]|nr:hypothetical protein [Bulleidia sp.]